MQIDKEKIIDQQIKDMRSFGVEMDDQREKYVRSCLEYVWICANMEGFREGASL